MQPGGNDKGTVFITGAGGFVGRNLASRLASGGYRLRCLVRNTGEPEADYLRGLGAELAAGDIMNADAIAAAARGCDIFIHLVGIIFEPRGATFEQIHVRGTMNALAAATVTGAHRYLHMSALGAGPDAETEYLRTKWSAEEAVRASGLAYTIFRPSLIYGPGGDFTNMLFKQVRTLPVIPVPGNGRYRLQPVSVFDVAACFAGAMENRKAVNREYEVCGPEVMDYNQLVDAVCRVLDKKRFKAHVPLAVVKPMARLSQRLMSRPLLTPDQLKMLLAGSLCASDTVRQDLGLEPMPLDEGLRLLI
ncbi:MAG TPA: complex I NDUFA9 subunit family protein [Actinobacteria bacterium]|nr:complex I NDUFA9 subunit family protein [Actinomycetota bacterium]